jgi:hypothetical protein
LRDIPDVGDRPLSLRNSRWRAWIRVHTPNFLYYRLGLAFPRAKDCGDHEWHNGGQGVDVCYHCMTTRLTPPDAPWYRSGDSAPG